LVVAAVGLAALVLNPFYACTRERIYTFSAEDMKRAVEGTWTLALGDRHYILHLSQASAVSQPHASRGLVDEAHACGKRTLVSSAHACLDISEMPLSVEISGDTSQGVFMVHGSRFREGHLLLSIAGQDLTAFVAPDGRATLSAGTLVRNSRR
jgi:hypothetical protein